MATFNLQFPDMSGMNSTDIKRELQKIKDYVYMLNEQLRYHFSNIDETNIVDGSIGESALSIPVKTQIQDTAGNVSKLQQTAKSISADIESIEGDLAQIVLEADSLLTRVENNEGDISSIQQAATALTSRVSNAEGNISTLTQTASSLTSRVSSNEGDISTLQQTATSLQSQITNNEGDISTLQQTTSNISASVQTIQGGITNKSMVEIADDRASIATSSGVQTSHISVLGNQIDIATGGKLNMQGGSVNLEAGSDMAIKSGANFDLTTNDFVLSNNRSDGVTMMSGGNSIANAPYWLTREGELNFSKLSDGATAMLNNMFKVEFYSGSVAPDNSIGINGALYVLHSASVGSTWSDTAASIPSAQGMQTWFGVYRNWNVLESGCRYIGNGKGTASTKNGTYFTFNAPANMSNATFVFVTNKRHPTQSYYLSTGTTTYRLEIRSGSAAGSLVGRKDFSAGTSITTQTVSVNGNFTKDTTYYCGIFYPESTELTNCTIVGGITLKGSSSSKEFGLYVKSNGSWKELI